MKGVMETTPGGLTALSEIALKVETKTCCGLLLLKDETMFLITFDRCRFRVHFKPYQSQNRLAIP